MLKFSYYIDNVKDKAWFDSSNVVYGECDESDTQYKTVRIVFKNGSTYEYKDVLVADWVSFKNADSQGKALNEYFKKNGYEYKRIDNTDLEVLEKELSLKQEYDIILKVDNEKLIVIDNVTDNELYSMEFPGEEITNSIKELLSALKYKSFIDNGE